MRSIVMLACVGVAVMPAGADTSASRRKYLPWATWSVGTWVRLKNVHDGQEDIHTMRMVSKTRDAARIKGTWLIKGVNYDVEYDHPLNEPESDGVPDKWTKTRGGYETIEVAGRRLYCRWTDMVSPSGKRVQRTWLSRDVPCLTVRIRGHDIGVEGSDYLMELVAFGTQPR